ncbi:cell wall metabolism sensor histidine kinase WalK [Telmatospirillum sp. J64-1]|uniref:sensor histidine kinase n=1 Tax=Telmatospirillum sp. J64-1 TaxID=2502183 RepID=UPI001C8F922D|nr:ATP-binding protein [Telmatospirillum sp. J64-1]
MRRLLPRSLAGQTVLVLLVGLTVSHLLSMIIYSGDRMDTLAQMDSRHTAARVAEVVRLFDETPQDWHERMLRAIGGPDLAVSLSEVPAVAEQAQSRRALLMRDALRQDFGSRPIQAMDAPVDGAQGLYRVQASVRLEGGGWLNFAHDEMVPADQWSRHLWSMALMAAGVVVLSIWVVRRLAAPLAAFAGAAERLGRNVEAPPLVEDGPDEVRQAARAFNRMQERLRRLVDNRTRMLAAISHDLRTPITLLKLRTEFMEDEEERARMRETLDEMEAMVASILAFARDDAAQEETRVVDLAALLSSICDDFSDAGAEASCEAPQRLPVEGRPLALKRAFTNLIGNAVKYGGAVRVHVSAGEGGARVVIEDRGPGIPEEELRKVLLPFYRVEASRSRETGGAGLGLSVASSVIHAHGGDLSLSNRAEGGLRVVVDLPL